VLQSTETEKRGKGEADRWISGKIVLLLNPAGRAFAESCETEYGEGRNREEKR
jgi:hypothetical protein